MQRIRVAMVGVGFVGRAFLELMETKADLLRERHGLELVLTGASDSSGAVLNPDGIDPRALHAHKASGLGVAAYPGGASGITALDMTAIVEADVLLEMSPVNLTTGQPGLDCVRLALSRGMSAVLANKGPLVHAFSELTNAAEVTGAGLAYSATVCGALPVINIGQRDLVACEIRSVRGIFNSTSNSILAAMSAGGSYEQALRQAQRDGIAEADPSLDVGGWDTANKLVIITNSILRQTATLANVVNVIGITDITPEQIAEGAGRGEVVKLIAQARWDGARYRLSVGPEWLPRDDFLAQVSGWEMGIVFDTDIMGLQQFKVDERGPIPTAAAMLRDVITLTSERTRFND